MDGVSVARDKWGSKLGFILATSGAAVGLGNILRFPYLVAKGGGAAFVFVYLLCVLLLGLPLILMEFSLGRFTGKNPIGAMSALRPNSKWKWVGALSIAVAFFILSYYAVAAAWTMGFCAKMVGGYSFDLTALAANPLYIIPSVAVFLSVAMYIVKKGVKEGVEKYNKLLMPLLVVILLFLVIRVLMLPGSSKGLEFYLKVDWNSITPKVFILALSQAFFSLCIGEAVLVTYGSYASKKENMVSSATYIAGFDTLVALLSGCIIFPAIFAFGLNPEAGVGITFDVLPSVFAQMPMGKLIGFLFFLLLTFAALTTAIALLEMPVSYLIDRKGMKRSKAVNLVGGAAFVLSIPAALSKGANAFLSNMTLPKVEVRGFYEIMDFIWGGIGMIAVGFFMSLFVGHVWKVSLASKELTEGCPYFEKVSPLWEGIIKYLAPVAIVAVLGSMFF